MKILELNGDLIHVPLNGIFIDEEVEETVEEVNNFFVLSFIHGFNRSQNVKDYKLSSMLIYKTKIDGVNYEFVSLPINRRKESILFLIGDKGFVDLYLDKRDKEIYYFDIEFLKIK